VKNKLTRRSFIKEGARAAALSLTVARMASSDTRASVIAPVRVGIVGVGSRGTTLLRTLLTLENIEVNALADIDRDRLGQAQGLVEGKGGKRPEGYTGAEDFRKLVLRDDLDAVITATPWELHTPVSVAAMKAGKYAATEVPAALTVEECWELVNASEATGVPCMMLENVCYFRDMLMILNMVRAGVFGELLHCEGGYQHDSRAGSFDAKGNFDEKAGDASHADQKERTQLWYTWHALRRDGNLYPTHPIGPIAQYLNIDRGDRFTHLVSMSSRALGLNYWIRDKFGPQHPNARRKFALGDINSTLIRTHNGCTVTLYYDTQAPRPYDLGFRVQGTKGIYQMARDSIYVEGLSPQEKWEPLEKYRARYEHPLWRKLGEAAQNHGHGGSDYLTLYQFVKAVRDKTPPEQDVYDAATWSVISPLSEKSVATGSQPMEFPDFTRGKWKTRQPVGIVEE